MSSTSISLDSLKFLLKHMDANRRFEISNRCPALRVIEKSVPLKINLLVLMKHCVIVNDTTYKLGIIRRYNVGEAPDDVTANNMRGGIPCEVDQYGIVDMSDDTTVTPGDVAISIRERAMPGWENDDVMMRLLEDMIQRNERQLANRQERRPSESRDAVAVKENLLQTYREKLLAYQCRQNNVPPNYEHFLQLTISRIVDKQEQKVIQRYTHNKKFSETMKQLTTVLFVIRLPVHLKFKIEQLMFRGDVGATLEALAPIVEESSYPLKKLDISIRSADDFTNHIVRTAAILKMRWFRRNH